MHLTGEAMEKHVIEVLGYRFTMEAVEQPVTDAEHALCVEIQERWVRGVRQAVQPWMEPEGLRLVYSADGGQADLEAPAASGPFRRA